MRELDPFTQEERRRIEANLKRPPEERFRALVERGIIDENGKVLVHMPFLESDFPPEPGTPPKAD